MVIDDADLAALPVVPDETDAPLVVDPDAVLALAASLQRLQPVGRRNAQVVEPLGVVQHPQFAPRDVLNGRRQLSGPLALPDGFGFLVGEIEDHAQS